MKTLTQEDLDSTVQLTNMYVRLHNRRRPQHRLREFPKKARIVHLVKKAEVEDRIKTKVDGSAIVLSDQTGRTYFIEENIPEEFELIRGSLGESFRSSPPVNDMYTLSLCLMLMHENLHRSCKQVRLPPYIADYYRDVTLDLFDLKGTAKKVVRDTSSKVICTGLRIRYLDPTGINVTLIYSMDEFFTHLVTSEILGEMLSQNGNFRSHAQAQSTLLLPGLYKVRDASLEEIGNAVRVLQDRQNYDRLLRDYLSGNVPRRLAKLLTVNGEFDKTSVDGLVYHVMGKINVLPDLVNILYHTEKK